MYKPRITEEEKRTHANRMLKYYYRNREKLCAQSRQRHKASPEKKAASNRRYREAHAVQLREKKQRYHESHREQSRDASRRNYLAKRKERLEKGHTYYATNRKEIKERVERYRLSHPEVSQESSSRRRARKATVPINDLTVAQWQEIKAAFGYRCAYCGRKMKRLAQDHITPLLHNGSHTASNIVPACQSCNSKKHTGPPLKPVQPLLFTVSPSRAKR